MAKTGVKFHILKVEVAHGSDRHDVALYSNTPPNVNDLLNELEKKTRVPKSSIQLIFKGQKLHNELNSPLSQFGIFSGNKLQMVGERLGVNNDAVFRRVLGISRDIGLIQKSIDDLKAEFSQVEIGGLDRTMIAEYVPQMHQRACGMKRDLDIFLRILHELQIDGSDLPDVKRHQELTIKNIRSYINDVDELLQKISNFKK